MNPIKTTEKINHNRRRFLHNATVSFAAAGLATIGSADAKSGKPNAAQVPAIKPGTNTSFGSLKQINAGLLSVGIAPRDPQEGQRYQGEC